MRCLNALAVFYNIQELRKITTLFKRKETHHALGVVNLKYENEMNP